MGKIIPAKASARLSIYGKEVIAASMYSKGKDFIGAALLLRKYGGQEYVVLHLLCQGVECVLKGVLLSVSYDVYGPQLKSMGHDLVKLADAVQVALGCKSFRKDVLDELNKLNVLYKKHLLRYGAIYDIFVDPSTIKSGMVLRKVAALIRLIEAKGGL